MRTPADLDVGAIVLAGGRARRLGGAPKPALRTADTTLLGATLDALRALGVPPERTVVVGGAEALTGPAPGDVRRVREDPPFGGPVAGIEAGLAPLETDAAPRAVFALACDMPRLAPGLDALWAAAAPALAEGAPARPGTAAPGPTPDAWVGLTPPTPDETEGRVEHLFALHRAVALRAALDTLQTRDQSVRRLLARLAVRHVPLPAGTAEDVDTWEDAARLGVRPADDGAAPEAQA